MTDLIPPATIAALRDLQESALPDVCAIHRPSTAFNEIGEEVETFASFAADVPCRFMRIVRGHAPDDFVQAEAEVAEGDARFTFAVGTDVQSTDRISFDGDAYEVVAVHRSGAFMTALRVDVRRAS